MTTVMHKIEYITKDGKRMTELHPDVKSANKASAKARENGCRGNYVMRSRVATQINRNKKTLN